MRLNLAPAEFEAEGFEETSRPHIANKNNAKIFYMLTSGFYSRPRESMFREICANALDESPHASRPFMVALPHALQPELVVRDWGRGMTHDFVMRRAMSLGDSTKDHDDNAIGGFGLGMKTPFCVTEQFSLVIYRGDHRQTYVIDREGGTPRPMTSPEMIEALEGGEQCTGTEIRIPIPEKNWGEFREIAQRILQLFPAGSFEIAGANVSPPEYVREAEKYAVLKQSSAPTYARMGCIAYRLDLEAIYGDQWQEIGAPSSGLELRFPIGALTVTPNREALLLDDATRASVKDAMQAALDDFAAELTARVQAAPTYWQAMRLYSRAVYEAGEARRFLPKKVQWQNAEMGAYISGIETPSVSLSYSRSDLQRYKAPRPLSRDRMEYKPHDWGARQAPPVWTFVLDDIEAGKPKKLLERAHMVSRHEGLHGNSGSHRVAFIDAAFIEALELQPGEYLLASDFEPPKPLRAAKGAGFLKGKQRAYNSETRSGRTECGWGLREAVLDRGGHFIPFHGSRPVTQGACALSRVSWYRGAAVWGMPKHLTKALDPSAWTNIEADAIKRASRLIGSPLFLRTVQWSRIEAQSKRAGYRVQGLFECLMQYRPACAAFGEIKTRLQAIKPQARLSERDLDALRTLREAGILPADLAASYDAAYSAPLPLDIEAEAEAYLDARPVFNDILQARETYARRGLLPEFFRAALIVKG